MSNTWPLVLLGNAAAQITRFEVPQSGTPYRQIGVRLWGEGAYERETIDGSETKYAQLNRVESGDIIVNKIWARNGSVAVVPKSLCGTFGSGEFPTFIPRRDVLIPEWFHWFTKTKQCWEQCDEQSRGTSGKNRIRPEKFLQIKIPLPPISEQRRLVAHIDALFAKIAHAHQIRQKAQIETEILQANAGQAVFRAGKHWKSVPLESVCTKIIDCLHSNPIYSDTGTYPTIRSPDVGWGTIDAEHAKRTDKTEYMRRTSRGELQPGDLILVREGGGTGKAGLVEQGQQFSLGQRVMMLRSDRKVMEPRFLLHQWLSPLIYQEQIINKMKGSAAPHLNIGALRQFQLLVPPIEEQHKTIAHLDNLSAKTEALKKLQNDTNAELDALLPSILDRAFKGQL